jgi:hypothetical protein
MSELTPLARRAALRLIVVGAPALAILPSAMSAEVPPTLAPDPVFAAIGYHKAAAAAFSRACYRTDAVLARRQGREVTQADEDAHQEASAAEEEALDDLMSTPPTTLPGMRAVLEHVQPDDDSCVRIVDTLLASPLLAVSRVAEGLADA